MNIIRDFLTHPMQFRDCNMWIAGLIYAIAVYLILVIMQPFGIYNMGSLRFITMLPFSIVTLIGCVAPYYVLPTIKKDFFQADRWTRGRYLGSLLMTVGIITLGILCIFVVMLKLPLSLNVAWTALWQTVVITLLVFGINMVLPERKQREQKKSEKCVSSVVIRGSGKNEQVDISLDKLLYVESDRNYCNIVTTDGTTQIRSTMTAIEEQLEGHPQMKKCHRAYLVNTDNILTTDGSSTTGYKLIMLGGLHSVPVARSYAKELDSFI